MKELKCPVCKHVLTFTAKEEKEKQYIAFRCENAKCLFSFYIDNIPNNANIKKLVEHYAQLLPKWTWG